MIGSFKWGEKKEEVIEIDGIYFRCKGIEHWSCGKVDGTFLTGARAEDRTMLRPLSNYEIDVIKKKLGWH